MGVLEARAAIRSDLPRVAIEAPAGCGKTFEAVGGAGALSQGFPDGRELLLLAHTNAAVGEFRRRVRQSGVRVRACTLDAFALEIVARYAQPLGLPAPVVPGDGPNQVAFRDLAPKAVELLRRAPTLARAIGRHYPVVFVDEHQDTRVEQHELIMLIVEAGGARLRTFADPMQAIYGIDPLVDWDHHCREADRVERLEDPHRWEEEPQLGEWIMLAREAMRNGRVLPLGSSPGCVRELRVRELTDVRNPSSRQVQPALLGPLNGVVRGLEGSVAVLTRYNAHVRGLNSSLRGSVVIQEGAEFRPAYTALGRAEDSLGDRQAMALALIDLLAETCTGLTKDHMRQLDDSLLPDSIDRGRRQRIRPLLDCLEPLYATPDLDAWCRALACILTHPPDWLRIDLPLNLQVVAQLHPSDEDSARVLLDIATRRRREGAPHPHRCVSTIHKAKGQEYDHVIVVNCGESGFPDTGEGRRLIYTAMSRAKRSLTLVVPGEGASPLVG
jgi:DNA helicase-2/ATP-dependent DNA helicase PcrA